MATDETTFTPMWASRNDVILRTHYHDNDGLPDQVEVVEAPMHIHVALGAIQNSAPWRLHIHGGNILVFGRAGLGAGRVAYQVYEWDHEELALSAVLLRQPPQDCEDCHAD